MGVTTIFNAVIVTIILTAQINTVFTINWSCSENGTAVKIIPSEVAGLWYEIARAPSSDVPACVKVTVPDTEVNNEYILKLNYVNNVNNGWKSTEEFLKFPWSEAENGIFDLVYSEGTTSVDVNFRYLGQSNEYALVCGYSSIASGISIVRVMSRSKTVSATTMQQIDALAQALGVDISEVTWVQQDGKCNGATHLPSIGLVILSVLYLLRTILL